MATNVLVPVFDGNVQGGLQRLKKACIVGGLFKEMKARSYYVKPSEARRRKSLAARKKERKRMLHTAAWDARHEND